LSGQSSGVASTSSRRMEPRRFCGCRWRAGELATDAQAAPALEVAEQYGVSRDRIRRAIQELVSEERMVVLHGKGRS